jgi:dipeptidyl-peptidase 4
MAPPSPHVVSTIAGDRVGDRRPGAPRPAGATVRYPAAGTDNPDVTLHLLGLDGSRTAVEWDHDAHPYLAAVDWTEAGLTIQVQSRDQRRTLVLEVDTSAAFDTRGDHGVVRRYDDAWVELVPGTPTRLTDGRLVTAADRDGLRRLLVDGVA